jgi:hypothetical protein
VDPVDPDSDPEPQHWILMKDFTVSVSCLYNLLKITVVFQLAHSRHWARRQTFVMLCGELVQQIPYSHFCQVQQIPYSHFCQVQQIPYSHFRQVQQIPYSHFCQVQLIPHHCTVHVLSVTQVLGSEPVVR